MNTPVMFSKASDEWKTPSMLFDALDAEFAFDIDAAAQQHNKLVEEYFGPDHPVTALQDSLLIEDWSDYGPTLFPTFWLNPPYSQCRAFIAKAALEASKGCTVVCLVPSRTDTRWWHESVWDMQAHKAYAGVEIRFIKGRIKFLTPDNSLVRQGHSNSAPFPSVIVIFRPVD